MSSVAEVAAAVVFLAGPAAANIHGSILSIDGVILSKLDGDARGGAALSIRAITGLPIKFVGTGEIGRAHV